MRQESLLPEYRMPGLVATACELLRVYQPVDAPYYGAFSGGKDSVVIKELARLAGVNVVWHYNVTTIDPPELVRFLKEHHPDVVWEKPKHGNFFTRMEIKGFPTRKARWCCEEYKESRSPRGGVMIFGVRAAESPRRAKAWRPVTMHTRTRSWVVSPIIGWSTEDVWAFIRERKLPYCSLYDEGFERLGCIGCPMAGERGKRREFARWPRYEVLWQRGFQRIWERRSGSTQRDGRPWFGDVYFRDWQGMWEWWLKKDSLPEPLDRKLVADRDLWRDEVVAAEEAEDDSCQTALDMFSGGGDP